MRTHVIFKSHGDKVFFQDFNKNITEDLTDECVMNYTTASSIVGTNPEWTLFHIKDYVLLREADFKSYLNLNK